MDIKVIFLYVNFVIVNLGFLTSRNKVNTVPEGWSRLVKGHTYVNTDKKYVASNLH